MRELSQSDRVASDGRAHHASQPQMPPMPPMRPMPQFAMHDIEPPSDIDRLLHALIADVTSGISPASLALAWCDWAIHLTASPGKWQRLLEKALRKELRLLGYVAQASTGAATPPCIEPLPQDRRFRSAAWQQWPFNVLYQGFLLNQQWWHNATTGIGGVSRHHEQMVAFVARQLLDMASPVNFMATNPDVLAATMREGGINLVRGIRNFLDDAARAPRGDPPVGADAFKPGRDVAVTPGQVVYRNRLIELIQYAPQTPQVYARPLLIVPAWIMKYYILDLSSHNSMVDFLVKRGHTVFIISWRNPDAGDRDLGMDDYLRLGVRAALDAVGAIVPDRTINTVGYCIGGTLLSIAAAALSRDAHAPMHSMTLLAAQTDFTEAGELTLFIDDSQLDFLDDMMWRQGYLDNRQMAGAFQLLRSHDLIWSRMVSDYLLGQRAPMTDLAAWNADATRMPYRMHSEYLRRLFKNNDLFQGHYHVDGKPAVLSDITIPVFAVGTETDHVAPWRSVYKFNLVADTDVTFLLTTGGHNAGIVSEPGHPKRRYRVSHWRRGDKYIDPETWYQNTPAMEGSWWLSWSQWLAQHAGDLVAPPAMGLPDKGYPILGAAPGRYVFNDNPGASTPANLHADIRVPNTLNQYH